jgi:hypothetical protein
VNAFFRWEFNSCEMLIQGDTVIPIDYANACPDVAVTSLHYYFPWAMKSLIKRSGSGLGVIARLRPHADRDSQSDVPRARARAVYGSFPRPSRLVGH